MRVFIAVPVPDNMKKALIGALHELKKQGTDGRFIPAQNYHITVAFLGEVKDTAKIREIMDSFPLEKTRLSFDGFEIKQDQIRMKVKANQKIKKYVSDLRNALKTEGFAVDSGKFEPHITVLRGMKGKRPLLPDPREEMTVTKICLMKSEEKDGKRIYKELYAKS